MNQLHTLDQAELERVEGGELLIAVGDRVFVGFAGAAAAVAYVVHTYVLGS